MNEVNELKTSILSCVSDTIETVVPPSIDVIWSTTDGIQLAPFTNENLPEIGGCQVSSILSTIEERSRDVDYVLTDDNLNSTDQLVKSIAFNVCSSETNGGQQASTVSSGKKQRNVILSSGQKQLYEEMVFFGCNLCPFICTKDSKISDHIDSVHRNPAHSYTRLKLKCPGCTNVFHHKLSLRSHLIYDHEVGKSDINKIVNGIVYVSSMMNDVTKNGCEESEAEAETEADHTEKQEIDFLQDHLSSEEENVSIEAEIPDQPEVNETPVQVPQVVTEPREVLEETPVKNDETSLKDDCAIKCTIPTCAVKLRQPTSVAYHNKCHNLLPTGQVLNKNFHCPECDWQCNSNWRTMQTHLWAQHKIDIDMFKCAQCEYRTHSIYKLNNVHKLIHGKAKPYLCDDCGKGFKNQKQLRNHKLIHRYRDDDPLKNRVHPCNQCQRTFSSGRQLRIHIQCVHEKLKPFSCTQCGYKAASNGALRLHVRLHTGERPFKCDQCEYATGDHNSLRRHRLRHSGVKKYSCPHCSYACIQSSTYKMHMKNKHPGQEAGALYTCELCKFRTLSIQKYVVHKATHATEDTQQQQQQQQE